MLEIVLKTVLKIHFAVIEGYSLMSKAQTPRERMKSCVD